MQWYLAKIVFQIICGEGTHTPQFDEQVRVVQARDKEEAFEKAAVIGNTEAHIFYNQRQQLVQWKFINIPELTALVFMDGAEVFSAIEEADDAASYIRFVDFKAAQIQADSLQPLQKAM